MWTLSLSAAVALADPPNQTVRLWTIGDGTGLQVERMAAGGDGDIVVGRTRGNLLGWLVDVDSWTMLTMVPTDCEVTGVAPILLTDGTEEVWFSCGNGDVLGLHWDGETLTDVVDEDGTPIRFDAIDETLSGLFYDPLTALLFAVSAEEEGVATRLHVIDPFALAWDNAVYSTYPKDLAWPGFNEAVVVDGTLIVSHGGQDMSSIQLGVDTAVSVPGLFTTRIDCDDLSPSPFGGVYCIDSLGQAADYRPLTNIFNLLPLGILLEPKAIVAGDDLTDGWLAVTGQQVKVWEMDDDGTIPSIEPYFEGPDDADNPIEDMITSEGYLYGGGIAGNLHVVTARPWVYPTVLQIVPTAAASAETATITLQIDEDADYTIQLGGARDGTGGLVLASGSAQKDEPLDVPILVDASFVEGDNHLYVIATNDQGLTGHGRVTLNVDNPPLPPTLTNASVAFADEALILSFDGIADADLDHYDIWVNEAPFSPEDWPTGGPAWDGATTLKLPLAVDAVGGAHVTKRIAPLENDVKYYIGVHAWDDGGKEGPMSNVVSGTPAEVFSAAQLSGEQGGAPCSTGPGSAGWLAVGAAAALAIGRSRRMRRAAAVGAVLMMAATTARAADEEKWRDMTPATANFELRYGVISVVDPAIREVYRDNPHNLLQLELGPQFFRVVEVDFGTGFFQELAYQVTAAGAQSGNRTMMTWFPFTVDGTLRGHILDEQPVVPFVRYGWDYALWSEKWDDGAGGKDVLRGAKFGTHVGLGGNILLDVFQRGRASFLEAQSGINDSWITVEWRRQRIDSRRWPWSGRSEEQLDLSGDVFQVGLKLDW